MKKDYHSIGKEIRKIPHPEKDRICEGVRESIRKGVEKVKSFLELKGSLKQKELNDIEAEILKDMQEGVSDAVHLTSYYWGIFLVLACIPMLLGDYFLTLMTLDPFEIGWERYIIAGVVMLGAVLAFHQYLSYIKKMYQNSYNLFNLILSFTSLVAFLVGIALLAYIRGDILETIKVLATGSAESKLSGVQDFYSSSKYLFIGAMLSTTIGLTFICGICLHEGWERIRAYKVSPLRKKRIAKKLANELADIYRQIKEAEEEGQENINQFEMGLASVEANKKVFRQRIPTEIMIQGMFSPPTIIIITILIILLIVGTAKGEETTVVLLDKTGSTLHKGYDAQTEFEKNKEGVKAIILSLKAGENLHVVAITCSSFSKPEILLQSAMPIKTGYFKEKLLAERISLAKKWDSLKIEADSKCTDVIGAIFLAANFLGEAKNRNMVIFSDLRHVVGSLDLETPNFIRKDTINKVHKNNLIPNLTGVNVHALGVHSYSKDLMYYQSLKEFWLEYFKRAGATVKTYSIERSYRNE